MTEPEFTISSLLDTKAKRIEFIQCFGAGLLACGVMIAGAWFLKAVM